jgi:general secretion pathway protein D
MVDKTHDHGFQGGRNVELLMRRTRWIGVALALAVVIGCATGRTIDDARSASLRGDHDTAVALWRQALAREPERIELRIALEQSTRTAAAAHIRRAREFEAQDQLAGALAEYRLAADLEPTSTLATTKAAELQRRLRELAEASRPLPSIDSLRQQAADASPVPRIDPRLQVPELRSTASVRDLLTTISTLTGINVTYDQPLASSQALNQPYSVDIRQMSLQDVLTQLMQANGLTFKVINPQTIFVYQDTVPNRQKYEDQYFQTFYVSHVDPQADLLPVIQQLLITGAPVPPRVSVNKSANSISVRATAPMMQQIERLIRANDRPRPEVMIEAEVLEVNRGFIRKLGLDLSQYALGFTFSPELAPPNTGGVPDAFPAMPPPFNANTISRGVSPADFYITSPTALVRLLESNTTTKVLAKPQSRGRDGQQMTLSLGDSIPIPSTTFNSAAAGGIANIPTTAVTYQEVGINLQFTPRVTYQDEIILDNLVLEKSGLGNFLVVAGQSFPTIVRRRSQGSIRLRDGESNLVAGLIRDDDRKTLRGLPGISSIPLLRSLFGSTDDQVDQTDIVMIITPHIVRGHELTPEDLRPQYVGAGQSVGGPTPPLISPDAIGAGTAPVPGQPVAPGQPAMAAAPGAVPSAPVTTAPTDLPPVATRAPGVVPIEAVPAGAPAAPDAPARVVLTAPTLSADGTLPAGGGPHTVPITISGAPPLSAITITITYNPTVLRTPTVTQGSFMSQGAAVPTFVPQVDPNGGRIDLAFVRPAGQPTTSPSGLLGAIAFTAGAPGMTDVAITGLATSVAGQTVPIEFTPIRLVVK